MNASLPSRDPDLEDHGQRFRLLVEPHTKSLYRAALHFTNNAADAEDLVQETLMRAWRGFNGFRSGTNARAWLLTILRNVYLEQYRRRKRRGLETVEVPDLDEWSLFARVQGATFSAETDDPETAFFAGLTSDHVAAAMASLPPKFREVFVLADLEGCSYREMSEILGIPLGTVMSRLFRARQQLQRGLWEYCVRTGQCRAPTPAALAPSLPTECADACRQIYLYLDRAVNTAVLDAIDNHLARCRQCCDRFQFQQRLTATVREALQVAEIPPSFLETLHKIVARF